MLVAVCHRADAGWKEVDDLASLSELRVERGNLLWVEADIANLTPEDVATMAEEFDLAPLAVEDAVHSRQRPKMESYEHHLFLVFHELEEIGGQIETRQIACFIGVRDVLTLHDGAARTLEAAKARWSRESADLGEGPAYLIHTLMDVIVDDYQDIADRLEEEIETLEEIVLEQPTAPVQRQLYEVKQKTARLRRYVLPLRRVLELLLAPDYDVKIPVETQELFRDVEDHILRIGDQVRNIDDLADAAIDLRRSAEAAALNEVTKRLTGWAAIIAVPTLISGIYGMNVGIYPHQGSRVGFWVLLTFMVVETAFLYWYFKKKRWI
ncbi:MAG: magnesium transporter CorA family protein [Actinomycetota bacterium]|nr:magnesium transporter CorA family protein [Actinomycetota bacterium]